MSVDQFETFYWPTFRALLHDLAGNVPISLLALGTPDEVRDYCKILMDTIARDGAIS